MGQLTHKGREEGQLTHKGREGQLTLKARGSVNTKGEGGGGQLIHIERGSQLTHSERGGEVNQQVEGMVYMLCGKSTYTGKWRGEGSYTVTHWKKGGVVCSLEGKIL